MRIRYPMDKYQPQRAKARYNLFRGSAREECRLMGGIYEEKIIISLGKERIFYLVV